MLGRGVRTSQPQGAVGFSPNFFTGLPGEFAWLPQLGGTPTLGSGATQTRVVLSVGPALEFAGGGVGAANHLSVGKVPAGTVSEYTFVLVVTRTATPTAYSQLALSCDVGGDGKPLVMFDDPDNTNLIFVKTSAGDVVSTGLLYNAFGSDPQCLVVSMIGGSKLTAVQRNLRTGAVNTFDGSMGGGAWTLSAGNAVVGGRAYGQYAMQANIRRYFSLQAQLQLSQNPWQIFTPDRKSLWTPAASVTLPTLVQPTSTTSAGAWTATGAASLHAAINELVASDTQYISVNSASSYTFRFAEAAFPGAANQTVAYRASSTQGSTFTIRLFQGATTITERTHALTSTDTLYTQTLTAGEIALITAGPIDGTLTTS